MMMTDAMQAELQSLRAEVLTLRADRARIDWLERMASERLGKVEIARSVLGRAFEVGLWPSGEVTVRVGNLRNAIDAARVRGWRA